MRFGIDVGSEFELKLYQALLLYRNDHGNRVMATIHGVLQTETNTALALGAGQLLSTAALRQLAKQLGTSTQAEYLPESVIARTPELIAWWTPASVRPMFFRQGSELADIPASSFHILLCCSRSVTACYWCVRFRRAKGRMPTPTWQQRPTGTSTITERCARAPCVFPSPFRSRPFPSGSRRSFRANSPTPEGQAV